MYTTLELGTTKPGPENATRYDGGTFAGITIANDPRATSAYATQTWAIDMWGTFESGLGIQWGSDLRTAARGGWACTDTGIYASSGDTIAAWCSGRGALAGQGYFELILSNDPFGVVGDPTTGGVDHGVVFPGAPPMD